MKNTYEEHAIFIQKILVHSGALFSELKFLQAKASKLSFLHSSGQPAAI